MPILTWKRIGKITLRAEPYLIMRLPGTPPYLALYGPQCARITIGRYDIATDAMRACQSHADAMLGDADPLTDTGQKKTRPPGRAIKPGIAPGRGVIGFYLMRVSRAG